jgi:glucokinase
VQDDLVDVTNSHWSFSKAALAQSLQLEQLLIINDFTAQALAQSDPAANGNMLLLDGTSTDHAPLLVIGPGTGLGVSALVPAGGEYRPLEGEGGHVGMSPQSDAELELFAALRGEVAHVSAEHFISGSGLQTIYRLQTGGKVLSAPDIGKAAVADAGPERDAANMMLGLLGSVVADAVLTMGCWRGVVIAGGIVAHIQPLVAGSPFAARFRHNGTMSPLLQAVPVWLSVDPHAGLRGAAAGFSNSHMAARMIRRDVA